MFTDLIKGLELTEDQKATLKANFEVVKPEIEQMAQSDTKYIANIKIGAFAEAKRKMIRTLGLDKEEVKDLEFEDLLNIAKDKVNETLKSTQSEKDAEIIRLKREIQNRDEEVIPSIKAESKNEITNFKKSLKLSSIVSQIPILTNAETALLIVESNMKSMNLDFNENGEIFDLEHQVKPKIGDKLISTIDEFAKVMLDKNNLLKHNNNGTPPPSPNGVKGDIKALPAEYLKQIEAIEKGM
jgi:hypothetical protein